MRRTVRTMLSVFLVGCCCHMAAAQQSSSRWRWWPLGGEKEADQPQDSQPSSTDGMTSWLPERPEVHLPEFSWPDYELPKPHIPRPRFWPSKSEVDEARNAWTSKGSEPERASPWQVVVDGAERLGDSTHTAWRKTVDALTPDMLQEEDEPRARVAQREPFWRRVFGLEQDEPQGPRTVTEWMDQERLNP